MKLFSVLTRKSIQLQLKIEVELLCKLLTDHGWFLKTNALLGKEYVGHSCKDSNKILYIPVESMEVSIPCETPKPSEEIIQWANELLESVDLKTSEVNRSIVYSIFGYQSKAIPKFVIATDKKMAKIVSKVLKANNSSDEQIPILTDLSNPSKLKEFIRHEY